MSNEQLEHAADASEEREVERMRTEQGILPSHCVAVAIETMRGKLGEPMGAVVTSPIQPGRKVEGIGWVIRPNCPLSGKAHATIRWAHNRNTGEVELFWGHYDLSLSEAREDFSTRVAQDR